jgi:hypothetical protein
MITVYRAKEGIKGSKIYFNNLSKHRISRIKKTQTFIGFFLGSGCRRSCASGTLRHSLRFVPTALPLVGAKSLLGIRTHPT